MKTVTAARVFLLVLLSWCALSLLAQEPAPPAQGKKITIQKFSIRPDGTTEEELIEKKGAAADTFDVDAYLKENDKEGVNIAITEDTVDGSYKRVIRRNNLDRNTMIKREVEDALSEVGHAIDEAMGDVQVWVDDNVINDDRAFLGVQPDGDDNGDEKGVVVEVVRCSAAEKAGLKTNDVLLKLNDTEVRVWSDISAFMKNARAGDKIQVTYSRKGKISTTDAVLTTRGEVNPANCRRESHGFMGISPANESGDRSGGVKVNIVDGGPAETAGLQDGDVLLQFNDAELDDWEDIEDFMAGTMPADKVQVSFRRDGKKYAKEVVLGKPTNTEIIIKGLDETETDAKTDWDGDWNWESIKIDDRQKDACLGVYSNASAEGAAIGSFTSESAAQAAELMVGDIITSINGQSVHNHSELWNEIAKYQPGDKISVGYLRDGQAGTKEIQLKPCDTQNRVTISATDDAGDNEMRRFYTWNWTEAQKERLEKARVITIQRAPDGDQSLADKSPVAANSDHKLDLRSFKAYPNPSAGPITIEFEARPVATIVNLLDLSGRQLFREELNAFNGRYFQQFDLSAYAKGTIVVQIIQGDNIFSEQVVIN